MARDKDHPRPVAVDCFTCGGSGTIPTGNKRDPERTCPTCGGSGQIYI